MVNDIKLDGVFCNIMHLHITTPPVHIWDASCVCSTSIKVYVTDFFNFCYFHIVLISMAKKIFNSDFPSLCCDVPKT